MSRKQDRDWRRIKQRREAAANAGKTKYTDQKLGTAMDYLGSKSMRSMGQVVLANIPDVRAVVAPFLGGGALEMEFLRLGKTVYAGDLYQPQANYWRALMKDGRRLAQEVDVLIETFGEDRVFPTARLRQIIDIATDTSGSPFRQAAAQWIRSKASVGGDCQHGGPRDGPPTASKNGSKAARPNNRRITKGTVRNILVNHYHLQRAQDRFHFAEQDWRQTLDQHPNVFAYLDPPYLRKNRYYQPLFDHHEFAAYLRGRSNWVMSNDDNPDTREIFDGFLIVKPQHHYGSAKKSNEVIVFSHDIRSANE